MTAQTLIALRALEARGALRHHFVPLQTFALDADRHVYNRTMRVQTSAGDGYYTSFPPLAVMTPYILFKTLGIEFSELNIQVFNLALHLAGALLLYLALRLALTGEKAGIGALAGAGAFVLFANNLWYLSNVYSWDTFWHVLFVAGIYCAIRFVDAVEAGRSAVRATAALCGVTFLFTYSEWQGLVFAGCFSIWAFVHGKRSPQYLRAALLVPAAAAAAVTLTVVQYASLVGLGPYLDALADRASGRSEMSGAYLWRILRYYKTGFSYALWPVLALLAAGLFWSRPYRPSLSRSEVMFFFLAGATVFVHHLLMAQWTANHPYSIVKFSIVLSGLIGWALVRLLESPKVPAWALAAIGMMFVHATYSSVSVYHASYARSGRPARYRDLGQEIASSVPDSTVIFLVGLDRIVPQLTYYAGRNIQKVDDTTEASEWLATHGRTRGLIFYVDHRHRVIRQEPVTIVQTEPPG